MKKNKIKILVIKLKRNSLSLIFLAFTLCLLLFSNSNIQAAKSGLKLWCTSVVPSLFPFFIATELLLHTKIPTFFGKIFSKIMKPIFNVSGEGCFAFIMGMISGYPMGAKIAVDLRNKNLCSKSECERLLSFTNNSGPLFILGTIGITFFGNKTIGSLLLFSHLLSAITVGIIFRFWKFHSNDNYLVKSSPTENKLQNTSFSELGEILSESISSSISTILMIGSFIVLFSVIISIFNTSNLTNLLVSLFTPICTFVKISPNLLYGIFNGFLEITNGISIIAGVKLKQISQNIVATSFVLGSSGLSILLQVWSIVSKSDLSIKPYILGKLLQGIISAIYTYLIILVFPIFNFNL